MKAIVCEMCGSSDLVKSEGLYVCQHCGMKYDLEEAKKLYVEVTGKVTLDNTKKLEHLYELARRAKDSGNYEDAEKYYSELLIDNPADWEASFYTTYCRARACKVDEISQSATLVKNSLNPTCKLIDESSMTETEKRSTLSTIFDDTLNLGDILTTAARDHYFAIDSQTRSNFSNEYNQRLLSIVELYLAVASMLEPLIDVDEQYKNQYIQAHNGVTTALSRYGTGYTTPPEVTDLIAQSEAKIKQFEPDYHATQPINGRQGCLALFILIFIISLMLTMCGSMV